MEECQADIFECSIENILPEQIITIRISYVTELKQCYRNGKIQFALPTASDVHFMLPIVKNLIGSFQSKWFY